MKIKLTFLFLCGYLIAFSNSQLDSIFNNANNHYLSEEYSKAIDNYHRILDSNYASFEVYYNLANSYYQFGKIPKSIYYYEKSLLIKKDEVCINNLSLAQKRIKLIEPIPQLFYKKWWNSISSQLSVKAWSILFISILWLTAVIFVLFLNNRTKGIFNILLISLVLSFLLIGFMYNANKIENKEYAIILEQAKLFNDNSNYQSNGIVDGGNKALVLEKYSEMTLILLQDGQKAWVNNSKIKSLKNYSNNF